VGSALRLRTEGLSWRELDGETILLDLHSSVYFRANRTGTVILRALLDDCDRDALVEQVAQSYGLPSDDVAADVDAFLSTLEDRGLLAKTPT
jgi:Coenzyme PQQ synthesis protein D (PqqD)